MKYWTVQSHEIIDVIIEEGVYQPVFEYSKFPKQTPDLDKLYDFVLRSFNEVNNSQLPGLIFSYAGTDNESIFEISDIDHFYQIIQENKPSIQSLWNYLFNEDTFILELEYDSNLFNPLFININDFQFMMPPVLTELYPYSELDVERIYHSIKKGQPTRAPMFSGLMQAHVPFIKRENIVNVYENFDFLK